MELYSANLIFEPCEQLIAIVTVVSVCVIFVIIKFVARWKALDKTEQCNKNNPQKSRSLKKNVERKMSSQSVGAPSPSPSFLKCSRMKDHHGTAGSPSGFITYSHPCYSSKYSMEGSLSALDVVDNDTGANLELDKLQIGSPLKGGNSHHHGQRHPSLIGRMYPVAVTGPTSYTGDDSVPLWKDYPMVHKGVASSYSYCSMPMSSYSNSMLSPPSVFRNYRSSSMATIFGGPKPLISPPKLDVGFSPSITGRHDSYSPASPPPSYSCYSGQGRHSWGYGSPVPAESVMPIYLTTPLSRSSSQSSGFISQKGFHTPPPSTLNYSAVPIATHPPRDPEGLSLYPEAFMGCPSRPQIQNFQTDDAFASFSSLSNYKYSPHSTWSASASTERSLGPVSMSVTSGPGRSLNGNTCSRFARKDTESRCARKRSTDIRLRPRTSPCFSEDEDDIGDEASFKSALTSMTLPQLKTSVSGNSGNRSSKDSVSTRLPRSKSKIRSGPFIRNLRATSLFDHNSKMTTDCLTEEDEICGEESDFGGGKVNEESSSNPCHNVSSVLRQLFWNLSLFLNIIVIFWILFGYPLDTQESHWVHRLMADITSEVWTNAIIYRDYFHNIFLEILSAREIHNTSHGNPSIFILNNEEL